MAKCWKRVCGHVALGALLLSACQPTPKTEPVVIKAREPLTQASIAEANAPYEAPAFVEETSTAPGGLTISIQAPVTIPEGAGVPVAVLNRRPVTNQEAADILYALGDWREIYPAPTGYSKKELEALLLRMEQEGRPESYSEEEFNRIQQGLMEALKTAPEAIEKAALNPYDWVEQEEPLPPLALEDSAGGTYRLRLSDGDLFFSKENTSVQQRSFMEAPFPLEALTITAQEAAAQGEALLTALGVGDMALAYAEPARLLESTLEVFASSCVSYGYWLCYMREMQGLATPYIGRGVGGRIGYAPDYAAPWRQERIDVYIDDAGVEFLTIVSRCGVQEILAQNARLLPFDAIVERIVDQLRYKHVWNQGAEPPLLQVYEIRLGLSIIRIPNLQDGVYLMPTWYVFYRCIQEDAAREDVIALSGLDGSCVEPRIPTAVLSQISKG